MRGAALQRQLRRQDGQPIPRHQRADVGHRRAVAGAASAASRASRSIRSSASAARRGYGKFYTYTDTSNMTPKADFTPAATAHTHDTVLLEWTAKNPAAATYDGGAAARAVPRRAAVREPQRRPDRVQSAGAGRAARISACSTSASPTAAAAATRSTHAQNLGVGVRQDPAHRSARQQQRERQVRHSGEPIRSPATASRTRSARSTPTACATRSASPGIRRTATCSSPTSARTSSRRSAR